MTDKPTIKEQLQNLKVGDTLKRDLHGGGFVTEGEDAIVKKIDEQSGIFWTDSSDGGYVKDSLYAYSIATGKSINNMVPGFFHTVREVVSKKTKAKKTK